MNKGEARLSKFETQSNFKTITMAQSLIDDPVVPMAELAARKAKLGGLYGAPPPPSPVNNETIPSKPRNEPAGYGGVRTPSSLSVMAARHNPMGASPSHQNL